MEGERYTSTMQAENKHPFELLLPGRMLDAIESLGLLPDGRMLALIRLKTGFTFSGLMNPGRMPRGSGMTAWSSRLIARGAGVPSKFLKNMDLPWT